MLMHDQNAADQQYYPAKRVMELNFMPQCFCLIIYSGESSQTRKESIT